MSGADDFKLPPWALLGEFANQLQRKVFEQVMVDGDYLMTTRPGGSGWSLWVMEHARMRHIAIRGSWTLTNGERSSRMNIHHWQNCRLLRLVGAHAARVAAAENLRQMPTLVRICDRYIEENFNG